MQEPLPQPFGPPAAPVQPATAFKPFNSPATLGKVLVGLLGFGALIDLLSVLMGGAQLAAGGTAANDIPEAIIALFQVFVFFGTVIVFLFWMHRAYSNLPSFGATDLKFTPGWAIGYFFVPVMNLFRPFEAMTEIWKASDPATRVDASGQWKLAATGTVLNAWWIMWLVSNIAGQAVLRTSLEGYTPAQIVAAARVEMIADFLGIISAILALLLVHEVTRRQQEKHQQTVSATQASAFTA